MLKKQVRADINIGLEDTRSHIEGVGEEGNERTVIISVYTQGKDSSTSKTCPT